MNISQDIFKAYDVRGLVPDEINEEVALLIGKAFAEQIKKEGSSEPIVVGYDMRSDSQSLAASLIEGIRSQGSDVIDIGQVATDMLYFAVGHLDAAGGAVVTASHNPGKYNGIKFCGQEARGFGIESGLMEVRDMVVAEDIPDSQTKGQLKSYDIIPEWINHALSFANNIKPFKVAVDAGNGMAGLVVPYLDEKTDLDITPLYLDLDGSFPNHEANPLKEETLEELKKVVVSNNLDLGIAFDGDGDRMVLVDERGESLSGSITTAILARYFLDKHPGAHILHNAICSRIVSETIKEYGGTPVRTRVGHSYIKSAMREYDAPFGGEHSAHYYFSDNYFADSGLIAAIVSLSILSESGSKLSELASHYRKAYVQSGEINFELKGDEDKQLIIEKIAKNFSDGDQDWLDGLSVNYQDWWFNLRASNTEPLLRLNIEARTSEQLDNLKAKITKELKNI
ncbi:MAG: phosphomannomutase/phosphoglucomutase [Candidatus Saccharimonadales bacterium]